ncbi:hypothetical protein [Methanothermobacter sp.]|uniref:hypothetical protein n=1 Tax=Methanothermobacter sp. TaxID=1884223 RepID=UPI00261C1D5F|nr:hypothetical protein [Methanothermobacter sp.]MDI9617889.1 hypothetical protein [Methanothermobacter sp.]
MTLLLGIKVPEGIITESSMASYLTLLAQDLHLLPQLPPPRDFLRVNHMQFENLKGVDTVFPADKHILLMFVAMVPYQRNSQETMEDL